VDLLPGDNSTSEGAVKVSKPKAAWREELEKRAIEKAADLGEAALDKIMSKDEDVKHRVVKRRGFSLVKPF